MSKKSASELLFDGRKFESVCIDLQVSATTTGVADPSPCIGLSDHDLKQICFKAGASPSVRCLSVSEYNPAIEKFKTGLLVVILFS